MRMRLKTLAAAGLALAVAGCATMPVTGDPAVSVYATAETQPVGTANDDAADDPAIWRNQADPSKSLIIGTDKKAGLHVYNLQGEDLFFLDAGLLNNVDLVTLADGTVLVAASDRTDPANSAIALFRLDTGAARLEPLGSVASGAGEAYGLCLWTPPIAKAGDAAIAFAVLKDGTINQVRIRTDGTGAIERTMSVPSQAEGCVVDHRTSQLYVGEENGGIWRFRVGGSDPVGELLAPIDNRMLVADVEGLALMPEGHRGGYLIASSQGDNAYAVFRLPGMEPIGRFRIAQGAVGATEETDGIDLHAGSFGPDYPAGLFVAQDGINPPHAQNFKLVSWEAVVRALNPKPSSPD
jgi:3-phytase|tara:strand:- start:546 stop:1601 length:1056 start_codon:yes stop_codon:yes gene_type:complete